MQAFCNCHKTRVLDNNSISSHFHNIYNLHSTEYNLTQSFLTPQLCISTQILQLRKPMIKNMDLSKISGIWLKMHRTLTQT